MSPAAASQRPDESFPVEIWNNFMEIQSRYVHITSTDPTIYLDCRAIGISSEMFWQQRNSVFLAKYEKKILRASIDETFLSI